MDRVELRRRLNTNGVPVIDQRMLRGGLRNINLRREIKRYTKEIDSFNKDKVLLDLENEEDFDMLIKTKPKEIKEPKMKKMRIGAGWF